jgi:hypothetical protein
MLRLFNRQNIQLVRGSRSFVTLEADGFDYATSFDAPKKSLILAVQSKPLHAAPR